MARIERVSWSGSVHWLVTLSNGEEVTLWRRYSSETKRMMYFERGSRVGHYTLAGAAVALEEDSRYEATLKAKLDAEKYEAYEAKVDLVARVLTPPFLLGLTWEELDDKSRFIMRGLAAKVIAALDANKED